MCIYVIKWDMCRVEDLKGVSYLDSMATIRVPIGGDSKAFIRSARISDLGHFGRDPTVDKNIPCIGLGFRRLDSEVMLVTTGVIAFDIDGHECIEVTPVTLDLAFQLTPIVIIGIPEMRGIGISTIETLGAICTDLGKFDPSKRRIVEV